MAEKKPFLTQEIVRNLYDNNKELFFYLINYSSQNQVDFNIEVLSDGSLSFKCREHYKGYSYLESITQTKDELTYSETHRAGRYNEW